MQDNFFDKEYRIEKKKKPSLEATANCVKQISKQISKANTINKAVDYVFKI